MDTVCTLGDAEDFCKLILSYPGRPTIDLEVCSNTNFSPYTYLIYGTYGSLMGSMTHIDWKYYIPAEAPAIKLEKDPLPGPSYCSDKLVFHEDHWDVPPEDKDLFNSMAARFYNNLYEVPYAGDWGETMGDFFNPAGGEDYTGAEESFLPMAAALSAGQKASMDFLSLQSLLMIGFGDAEAYAAAMPDIDEIFDGVDQVSVYTGVNRAAFRSGVALTSEALMEQNAGNGNAYDKIWDNTGIVAISAYAAAAVSVPVMIAGGVMAASKSITYTISAEEVKQLKETVEVYTNAMDTMKKTKIPNLTLSEDQLYDLNNAQTKLNNSQRIHNAGMSTAGRWMLGRTLDARNRRRAAGRCRNRQGRTDVAVL